MAPADHVVDFEKTVDVSALAGKSVLITGGASGMGALMATTFAQHKAQVTIADINKDTGSRLVKSLGSRELHINFVPTDVTSWESQAAAFKSAIKFSGRDSIDIVVAAAGLPGIPYILPDEEPASLEKDPPRPAMIDEVYNVNVKGVHYTSKLAQHYFGLKPAAQEQDNNHPRKTLILISSIAGYLELNSGEYTAAKWGVRGLFRSIRSMMEDMGYRTNLIAPWVMDTPLSKDLADMCRAEGIPIGKLSDVVDAVIRCAADDTICGRALAIGSAKSFDLEDDLVGLNSGNVMAGYHQSQECKGLMDFQKQRP